MLKSIYNAGIETSPEEMLKKKMLKESKKKEMENIELPSTEEIDYENFGNKPAMKKSTVDKSVDFHNRQEVEITGGNYQEVVGPAAKISKQALEGTESVGSKIGAGVLAGAGGIMDMAGTVMAQKGPMNKQERKANTVNLGMKGASTGATIGSAFGPVGTAIGAGAGLIAGVGTGLIQGIGDQKELDAKAKLERSNYLHEAKDSRMKAQRLSDGKKSLEKSKNILQAQMGLIGGNYSK